jgi:hypothetical protein
MKEILPRLETRGDELVQLVGEPTARLVHTYPVWRLPDHASRLQDAEDTGQVHCHLETTLGVAYLRASVRGGQLQLDQGGNAPAAAPYVRAASDLAAPDTRVLLARHGTTALWDPATSTVAVVASGCPPLTPGHLLAGPAFEAAISRSDVAPGAYVRFWPDGESGARWVEGEVTRVHGGVVLEIRPQILSETWGLAAGDRVDPSYDLRRGGVLRHVEPLTTRGPRAWVRLSPLSPRDPRARRLEYQGAHDVRIGVELRQEGRRELVVAYFLSPDEHRGYAACLRVATQVLEEAAEAAAGTARPSEDLARPASLDEGTVAHRWPRGGQLELRGEGAWTALARVLEPDLD